MRGYVNIGEYALRIRKVSSNTRQTIQPYLLQRLTNAERKRMSHTIHHEILERLQCHPAAAEGAKLSKMRRGNALLADIGVSDHL